MGPQASKMSPRAPKITQNHQNMVTQNQENPGKKTSRNGTVAGYARSALDTIQQAGESSIEYCKRLLVTSNRQRAGTSTREPTPYAPRHSTP